MLNVDPQDNELTHFLQDIDLVKAMGKPPAGVQLAMKAVLVMLETKPDKKPDPDKPGAKIDDWWQPAVRLLGSGTLLPTLKVCASCGT